MLCLSCLCHLRDIAASSCGALTVAYSDQAGGSIVGTTTDTATVICDDGYSGSGTAVCTADSNATTATWSTVTCTGREGVLLSSNVCLDG